MAKKNVMPKSKAKTAYGLLSEIRKLILEEPKRYDQTDFLYKGKDAVRMYGGDAPACGTVGCVAGWVCALKSPRTTHADEVPEKAGKILGIGSWYGYSDQAMELFRGSAAGVRVDLLRHAERGAAHIARFQKKYAAQLKAKRV